MLLAEPSEVLRSLGVPETNQGALANATSALKLSLGTVESVLETRLSAAVNIDYYDGVRIDKSGSVVLRLTNRFPDKDTVKVYKALDANPLYSVADGELLSSDSYKLNTTNGVVTVSTAGLLDGYGLAVSYESGFSASEDEVVKVPDFVKQAGITAAVLASNVAPSTPANRQSKTVVNVADIILKHLGLQLQNYRRPRLLVVFPDRYEDLTDE